MTPLLDIQIATSLPRSDAEAALLYDTRLSMLALMELIGMLRARAGSLVDTAQLPAPPTPEDAGELVGFARRPRKSAAEASRAIAPAPARFGPASHGACAETVIVM